MLNNFSSYFEIFGGLNLAYAGSKVFRNAIDDEILKLKERTHAHINLSVESLRDQFFVLLSEDNTDIAESNLKELQQKFNEKSESILKKEVRSTEFTEGFKSMFLATSLYCIAIILLGGYEQYCIGNLSHLINLFLIFLLPLFIFNTYIFIRSFTIKFNKNIKPLKTISFVLILLILCFLTKIYCPYEPDIEVYFQESTCITFSVIIAVSPYLFHFLRVFIHKAKYRYKFHSLVKDVNKEIERINGFTAFFKKK